MVPKEASNFIQEKKNVLDILENAVKAIQKEDFLVLKDLSDRTIHSASIFQDVDSISIAVVIYALSKIYERSKYTEYRAWPNFSKACIEALKKAKENVKSDNVDEFRINIQKVRDAVKKLSGNLKRYIEDVFRRAMIKKASRIYEHGISMKQTAEILGISEWELSEYVGKTGIGDVNLGITMNIKERIRKAEALFRK